MAPPSGKRLRSGFTTGTAATAAVKAALIHLLGAAPPGQVEVLLLNDTLRTIPIETCRRVNREMARCTVIKDAGDDPDITNGARIGAQVCIRRSTKKSVVRVTGGRGVGMVTKPGLGILPGQPAITAGPLKMIHQAVAQVLAENACRAHVSVEIFVPQGQRLALKTLNGRLGIVGGISILGTTGEVRPLSHVAYIATIDAALSVARAAGLKQVVLTTGRRSERFAQARWPSLAREAFIQMGDYFARAMAMAAGHGLEQVILAVFFGKAVKMAQGIAHTHARTARLTLDRLSQWALEVSGRAELARRVAGANTARQVFDDIKADCPDLIKRVGCEVVQAARGFAGEQVTVRAVIFDFDGSLCFDSQRS